MTFIPQMEAITTLKKNHLNVLKKLGNGPVFLSQRSRMAAVLLSTSEFEALMKERDPVPPHDAGGSAFAGDGCRTVCDAGRL